jgi:glycosyltransferase involved in cell wall biosynthesis
MLVGAAFAFPSSRRASAWPQMEALAAGVPVVARDLPVLRGVRAAVGYGGDPQSLAAALRHAVKETDPPA